MHSQWSSLQCSSIGSDNGLALTKWVGCGWGWVNTLRPRKMDAIFQTTYSNAFSWMKMLEFLLRFHWSLFIRVQLTILPHVSNRVTSLLHYNKPSISVSKWSHLNVQIWCQFYLGLTFGYLDQQLQQILWLHRTILRWCGSKQLSFPADPLRNNDVVITL